MDDARRICAEQGLRLTETRARVLEILLESHAALGAYDILDRLRGEGETVLNREQALRGEGRGAQPPVAYRALDFLTGHGLAHRIERLNAFVACAHPGRGHDPAFLICRDCGAVAEAAADALVGSMDADAARLGFDIERRVIEAEGLCPGCRPAAADAP